MNILFNNDNDNNNINDNNLIHNVNNDNDNDNDNNNNNNDNYNNNDNDNVNNDNNNNNNDKYKIKLGDELKLLNIENIVISGGGMYGFIFVGILKFLNEYNMIKKIKKYYGTSIGAIILILMAIGFNVNDIINFAINFDFMTLMKNDIDDILSDLSMIRHTDYEYMYKRMIKHKKLDENITLQQLYNINNIELYITGYNITDTNIEIFNHKTHPDIELWKVMYITSAIPAFCNPLKYENKYYCDGGIRNNIPIDIVNKDEIEKTICIYIEKSYNGGENINNIIDNINIFNYYNYISIIFNVALDRERDKIKEEYNVFSVKIADGFNNLNFSLTNEDKINKIQYGYNFCRDNIHIIINKIINKSLNKNGHYIKNKYNII